MGNQNAGDPSKCRWQDNINIDLKDVGVQGVDWIHVAQNSDQLWLVMSMVMNFMFSETYMEFLV